MARFRARKNTYFIRKELRTRSVWHPQIFVEGQWAFLADETTSTKLVEAADEETATELAIKAIREIDSIPSRDWMLQKRFCGGD